MNPRPNLTLNPNKVALSKSIALTITTLSKNSKLSPKDKEPWKYIKNICDFFTAKEKRTWNASLMLSSAIVASRFERHSKDAVELDGFQAKLVGNDLSTFKKIIHPADEHGFDYSYGGPKAYRQGLQSEFLHDKYAGTCPNPSVTYTKDGVDSLLVKFIMPNTRKEVKGYTHRGHVVRVDYKNKHNLHMLYHKLVKSKLSNQPEVVRILDDFEDQYLNVRADEKLIKIVFLIYTQFEYKHNSRISAKSVFVMNPSRMNTDHVRIPVAEKKGVHGSLPKDLADKYLNDAIRMFDSRLSVGVVKGLDGKEYLGYPIAEVKKSSEEEPKEAEATKETTTENSDMEYSNDLNERIEDAIAGIHRALELYTPNIESCVKFSNFERLAELSTEADKLKKCEQKLMGQRKMLNIRIDEAKELIEKANKRH